MNEQTRDAVRQWLAKADSDWRTVEILLDSQQCPHEVVCFHCQQFVEKLLKAFLTMHSVEAPKTHDFRRLIQLAEPFATDLSDFTDQSDKLTVHGVETRYPGDWFPVSPDELNEIVELSRRFRDLLLRKLA